MNAVSDFNLCRPLIYREYAVGKLVEALRNRPEGRGFDFGIEIFHCHNPSGGTMAPRSTQSLTEMSIRNILWVVKVAGA